MKNKTRRKKERESEREKKNEELVIISIVHLGKHSLRNSHIDETNFFYCPIPKWNKKEEERDGERERGREKKNLKYKMTLTLNIL